MISQNMSITIPLLSQLLLTGELRVQLTQLRTNVNVDHAGPSQLLVLLKVETKLRLVHSSHSQNNNSLIAQLKTEVVMVEIWDLLSTT